MAELSLRGLGGRPSRLTLVLLVGLGGWVLGPLWQAWPALGPGPLAHCIRERLPLLVAIGGMLTVLRAAAAVPAQVGQRLVSGLFARPLAAWEYLLGQAIAHAGVYLGGIGALWLVGALAAAAAGTSAPEGQLLWQACGYVPAVVAGLSLAAVSSTLAALALLLLVQMRQGPLAWAAGQQGAWAVVARWAADLAPVDLPQQAGWLWLWAGADSLAYALMLLAACAWWFERTDLPLRPR